MGIMLEKGSHDITLKYTPAGFKAGLAISSAAIVVIIAISAVSVVLDKNRKKKALVSVAAPVSMSSAPEGEIIEEVPVSEILTESSAPVDEAPAAPEEAPAAVNEEPAKTESAIEPSQEGSAQAEAPSEEPSKKENPSEDQPEKSGETTKPEADND